MSHTASPLVILWCFIVGSICVIGGAKELLEFKSNYRSDCDQDWLEFGWAVIGTLLGTGVIVMGILFIIGIGV